VNDRGTVAPYARVKHAAEELGLLLNAVHAVLAPDEYAAFIDIAICLVAREAALLWSEEWL
jgi:hypothetical protein